MRVPTEKPLELTKVNATDGYVHGFETSLTTALWNGWTAQGGFTWMKGYTDIEGGTEYIRTMPMTAFGALRKTSENRKFWAEIAMNSVSKEDRLSKLDERDTQRIPASGTPGYVICHLRAG